MKSTPVYLVLLGYSRAMKNCHNFLCSLPADVVRQRVVVFPAQGKDESERPGARPARARRENCQASYYLGRLISARILPVQMVSIPGVATDAKAERVMLAEATAEEVLWKYTEAVEMRSGRSLPQIGTGKGAGACSESVLVHESQLCTVQDGRSVI